MEIPIHKRPSLYWDDALIQVHWLRCLTRSLSVRGVTYATSSLIYGDLAQGLLILYFVCFGPVCAVMLLHAHCFTVLDVTLRWRHNEHQRKHQSPASLAFVWGIHRGPVNSPHKWPVTRKMSPFDDVIMSWFKSFKLLVIFCGNELRHYWLRFWLIACSTWYHTLNQHYRSVYHLSKISSFNKKNTFHLKM